MTRSLGIVAPAPPRGGFGSGSADFARQLWWERRLRSGFFPPELFGEPVWDLLLDVFASEAQGQATRLSKAHLSACVTPSAAQRKVRELMDLRIVEAEPVEASPRSRQLTLSSSAKLKIESYLEEVWFHRASQPGPSHETQDVAERDAALNSVRDVLRECRDKLDEAGAWQAGAYLSQAISLLERVG